MTPTLTSLTDDQKNIALAEARGICTHPRSARRSETVEDGNSSHTDYWCDICKEDPHRTPAPDYLHDERAAITLCDTLGEKGWDFMAAKRRDSNIYAATFCKDHLEDVITETATSLATAISNCAIIALNLATK